MDKRKYSYFKQHFKKPYTPIYGYCPTVLINNIMIYYEVNYDEASDIYRELSLYYGSLVRLNDFLYKNVVIKGNK